MESTFGSQTWQGDFLLSAVAEYGKTASVCTCVASGRTIQANIVLSKNAYFYSQADLEQKDSERQSLKISSDPILPISVCNGCSTVCGRNARAMKTSVNSYFKYPKMLFS